MNSVSRRTFLANCAISAGALSIAGCGGRIRGSHEYLLAGAAKREVTPPLAIPYLTSSARGTSVAFTGIHDPLFARALCLDDGNSAVAILTVDSIGYDNAVMGRGRDFTAEVRHRVRKAIGLPEAALMLASTHSHSTPETIGLSPLREAPGATEWLETQVAKLADTVIDAWQARTRVKAFHGVQRVTGIARNRRILLKNGKLSVHGPLPHPEEIAIPPALDEDLNVLFLRRENGAPHSVLLNYTAHPVVAMLLPKVCADYPGVACRQVETEYPGSVCLFTNGAAGNINSVSVSTNFEDVQRLGTLLGNAAASTISHLESQPSLKHTSVSFATGRLELEPRSCPSVKAVEKLLSNDPSEKNQQTLRLAKKLAEGRMVAEVQAMSLGEVKWVSLPGEPFVETGLALKNAGTSFVVGYANNWLGYFPIRRAYAEGGYETAPGAWSRVAPGSAERLEAFADKILNKLKS